MIRCLDLFCGGGGSSWGAWCAGAEIVGGVDSWDLAVSTFADNFPSARAVQSHLTPDSGREVFGDVGPIDLILASPECTNHTCAKGGRDRCEDSRRTAEYILNFADAYRPRWIILENVIHMRSWTGYPLLLSELSKRYHVTPQVLDSADFGVPQNRSRLYLVCDREEPAPDLSSLRLAKQKTVRDILDYPGTWRRQPLYKPDRSPNTLARAERGIRELGEGVPFLVVYYGSDGAGGWQSLDRPIRTLTTLDRFGLIEWDEGHPTLRMLQVPELKRAMGFEVDSAYHLNHGARRDRIRLLGNGVCPPVIHTLVKSLTVPVVKEAFASSFFLQPPESSQYS